MPMKNDALNAMKGEPTLSLAQLQEAVGPPDPALDNAFFHGVADADLVAVGQRIGTPKILTDMRRLYPTAFEFWGHATEGQRDRLLGFSLPLLGIAVSHAITLQGLLEDHTTRAETSGVNREGRERDARDAFGAALLLRDQAITMLRPIVTGDPELSAAVTSTVGTADTPEKLAKAVKKLAAVGTRILAEKKGPIAVRAKLFRLDTSHVEQLDTAADRLATATEKSRARSGGARVSQGMLDLEDGKNLRLLGHLIDAFDVAHDIDPTIPRLVPITTRVLFGRSRRDHEKAAGDEKMPSPEPSADSAPPTG